MADLLLIETGDGGDLVLRANDIVSVGGVENMPYMEMFGGDDWWGDDLTTDNISALYHNSETEKVLQSNCLNSAGRIKVESAIKKDLAPLIESTGATLTVETNVQLDRVEILVNLNGQYMQYIWHPDTQYLTYKI